MTTDAATYTREETMVRFSACSCFLVCILAISAATAEPLAKDVEINGVRLRYVEQGSGEPAVFVHGIPSDLRAYVAEMRSFFLDRQ